LKLEKIAKPDPRDEKNKLESPEAIDYKTK